MDVLSDVLLSVRLAGAVFFDIEVRSPFVTETPGASRIGSRVMAGADHVIGFHTVTEGSCWAEAIDAAEPQSTSAPERSLLFLGGMPTSWLLPLECGGRSTRRCTIDRPINNCRFR